MTNRRGQAEAPHATPMTTAGRREAAIDARRNSGDVSVRDFLATGGRRGFTIEELLA